MNNASQFKNSADRLRFDLPTTNFSITLDRNNQAILSEDLGDVLLGRFSDWCLLIDSPNQSKSEKKLGIYKQIRDHILIITWKTYERALGHLKVSWTTAKAVEISPGFQIKFSFRKYVTELGRLSHKLIQDPDHEIGSEEYISFKAKFQRPISSLDFYCSSIV